MKSLIGHEIGFFDDEDVKIGLTAILDKIDFSLEQYIPIIKKHIQIAKIGWGSPLLLERSELKKRIKTYQKHGIQVSTGGTFLELAVWKKKIDEFVNVVHELGFDIIEVSDGSIHLPTTERYRLIRLFLREGFHVLTEVGKKIPGYKLNHKQVTNLIEHDLEAGADKVIIEARERGRNTCLFDEEGNLDLLSFHRLINSVNIDSLIFEAPLPINQVQLLKEIGPSINLSNINVRDVVSLQSFRLGVRGDTFIDMIMKSPEGGPSVKFVYYLLKDKGPMDMRAIQKLSSLPMRTIQEALRSLYKQHLVGTERHGPTKTKIWYLL